MVCVVILAILNFVFACIALFFAVASHVRSRRIEDWIIEHIEEHMDERMNKEDN